jgi:predicted nucleotidyltransferase
VSERTDFQPTELLQRLLDAEVRFVVIGGLAAQAHGSPSLTADLDIVPSWDPPNLARLADVLREAAAIRHGAPQDAPRMPPLDGRTLLAGAVFTLDTRYGRLDLLANPDPGLDYERLARSAKLADIHERRVSIASLDDLIAMKRAAGRPKDRVELEILGALREEIDRSEGR